MRLLLFAILSLSSFAAHAVKFDSLKCAVRISPSAPLSFDLATQPIFPGDERSQQGDATIVYNNRNFKFATYLFLNSENGVDDLRLTVSELDSAAKPIWKQYVSDITPGQVVGYLQTQRFPDPKTNDSEMFTCRPNYKN